jgi:hypothetical protein
MVNYGTYTGMINAFMAGQIDWINNNEPLLPVDYNQIYNNPTYTFGFVNYLTLDEYDLNCAVLPFSNTMYREAVSDLVNANNGKVNFINMYFGGAGAAPAYSPIAANIPANSIGGIQWYNSATAALWQGSYQDAFLRLMASGLTPIPAPGNPACFTWQFASPFPNPGPNGAPAMSNSMVYVYAVSDKVPARLYLGTYLQQQLGPNFAAWGAINQAFVNGQLVAAGYPGLVGLQPTIEVTVVPVAQPVAYMWVMHNYQFEVYTGEWCLRKDCPDNLELWLSEYAASRYGFTVPNLSNYGSITDAVYDTDVFNMKASSTIGTPTTMGTGSYWCYMAQMQLMSNAWLIPMWYYTFYSPCLTSDYQNINEVGEGFANWWSFLNAYPTSTTTYGTSPGYATNSMILGMSNGFLNPNIISDLWRWDWNALNEIYDPLVRTSPYNVTQILPYLADAFNESTWTNTATGANNTVMNIHLRSDVWWQDLPYKLRNSYTLDNDSLINGPVTNMPFTALDVAFTLAYYALGNLFTSVNAGDSVQNIDHITISSIYQPYFQGAGATTAGIPWANETYILSVLGLPASAVWCPYINPYETLAQYENNIVQFSPTLDPYTVQAYLSSAMTWKAYYTILGVPIIPWYIFSHLALGAWPTIDLQGNPWTTTDVTAMDMTPTSFSASGADILYGTGPYIWVGQPVSGEYEFIPYVEGVTYEGLTEANGYFWQPVRDADTVALGHDPENVVTFKPGNSTATAASLCLTEWVQNWLPTTVTVNFYFSVTYSEYNASGWSTPMSFNTATNTATLPASSLVAQHWWLPSLTSETVYEPAATPLSEGLMGKNAIPKIKNAQWLILETDFEWSYTWTPDPSPGLGTTQTLSGASGSYLPNGLSTWDPNERPAPWWTLPACWYYPGYPYEIINLLASEIPTTGYMLEGDIGGAKQLISPYPGADGAVNLKDLTVIATSYLKKGIVWTSGSFDPTDSTHRADIDGNGAVNLKDLTYLALEYLKSYSFGKPPTTPPPAA